MRFAVRLAYKGTNYSGWQSQNNAKTVQGEIESVLFKLLAQHHNVFVSSKCYKGNSHKRGEIDGFKARVNTIKKR